MSNRSEQEPLMNDKEKKKEINQESLVELQNLILSFQMVWTYVIFFFGMVKSWLPQKDESNNEYTIDSYHAEFMYYKSLKPSDKVIFNEYKKQQQLYGALKHNEKEDENESLKIKNYKEKENIVVVENEYD